MYTEWKFRSLSFKLDTLIKEFSCKVVHLSLGRRDGVVAKEVVLQPPA